jgi:hypothetical protein
MSAEPIVFWGPGSEWFWTMLQFVVVAVTLVGISYQFRLQRAANAFEHLNRMGEQLDSEQMLRARLEVARALVAGAETPQGALFLIGNYWDSIGSLVRERHVDERLVSETLGGAVTIWWIALSDATGRIRKERMDPTVLANFEWLAKRVSGDDAKSGAAPVYDKTAALRIFEAGIPSLVDRIRMAEESRMVPERRAPRSRRAASVE